MQRPWIMGRGRVAIAVIGFLAGFATRPRSADREAFFAAQARNRPTTWRLTALCLMGVALMGIPISAVLTPLLLAPAARVAARDDRAGTTTHGPTHHRAICP